MCQALWSPVANIKFKVDAARKDVNSQGVKIILGPGECCEGNKPEAAVSARRGEGVPW